MLASYLTLKTTEIIVLGGMLAAIGALITLYGQHRASKEKSALLDKIDHQGQENNALNDEQSKDLKAMRTENNILRTKINRVEDINIQQIDKIDTLKTENQQLSRELAQTAIELKNNITGGNSFCYLILTYDANDVNKILLFVMHQGEYTLKDVTMRIDDLGKRTNIIDGDISNIHKLTEIESTYSVDIGNLGKNSTFQFNRFRLGENQNEIRWAITFFADNGTFHQNIRHLDIRGTLQSATQVTDVKGNLLYENVFPGFPRDSSGRVLWE